MLAVVFDGQRKAVSEPLSRIGPAARGGQSEVEALYHSDDVIHSRNHSSGGLKRDQAEERDHFVCEDGEREQKYWMGRTRSRFVSWPTEKAGSKVSRPGRFSSSVAKMVGYRATLTMQTR